MAMPAGPFRFRTAPSARRTDRRFGGGFEIGEGHLLGSAMDHLDLGVRATLDARPYGVNRGAKEGDFYRTGFALSATCAIASNLSAISRSISSSGIWSAST